MKTVVLRWVPCLKGELRSLCVVGGIWDLLCPQTPYRLPRTPCTSQPSPSPHEGLSWIGVPQRARHGAGGLCPPPQLGGAGGCPVSALGPVPWGAAVTPTTTLATGSWKLPTLPTPTQNLPL